MVIYYQKTA